MTRVILESAALMSNISAGGRPNDRARRRGRPAGADPACDEVEVAGRQADVGDPPALSGLDDAVVGLREDGAARFGLVFWMSLRMASVRALGALVSPPPNTQSWRGLRAAITGAGSYSKLTPRSTFGPSWRATLEGAVTIIPVKPSWPKAFSQGALAYLAFRASKRSQPVVQWDSTTSAAADWSSTASLMSAGPKPAAWRFWMISSRSSSVTPSAMP